MGHTCRWARWGGGRRHASTVEPSEVRWEDGLAVPGDRTGHGEDESRTGWRVWTAQRERARDGERARTGGVQKGKVCVYGTGRLLASSCIGDADRGSAS